MHRTAYTTLWCHRTLRFSSRWTSADWSWINTLWYWMTMVKALCPATLLNYNGNVTHWLYVVHNFCCPGFRLQKFPFWKSCLLKQSTHTELVAMTHLHWRRRTRVRTRIQIPNPKGTLYYAEDVHIAQTRTQIPTLYFCKRTGIGVRDRTRVRLRQCKWATCGRSVLIVTTQLICT